MNDPYIVCKDVRKAFGEHEVDAVGPRRPQPEAHAAGSDVGAEEGRVGRGLRVHSEVFRRRA